MDSERTFPRLERKDANSIRVGMLNQEGKPSFDRARFEEYMLSPKAFPATGSPRIHEDALMSFREACVNVLDEFRKDNVGLNYGSYFDIAVGKQLDLLKNVAGSELGVASVWDFITLVLLPDLAFTRITLPGSEQSEKRSIYNRLKGGDRRHVLQRLWRRRVVLGSDMVNLKFLTEDDYGALLERRLTLERPELARRVALKIVNSGFQGSARRNYTRTLMRTLMQMSGVVHFSDSDLAHLGHAVDHADAVVKQEVSQPVGMDISLPSATVNAIHKTAIR